jgi:hypothetical protein
VTEDYAGLDVSDKSTHICLVDEAGAIAWRGVYATDPRVLADALLRRCPELAAAKGPRRARVAVARKLAALLYTLWRSETDFRWT